MSVKNTAPERSGIMPIDQPGSANLNPSSFTRIDTVRRSIRGGEQLAWGASVFIEGSVGIGIGLRGIGIDCGAIQRWYVNGDGAHLVSPT